MKSSTRRSWLVVTCLVFGSLSVAAAMGLRAGRTSMMSSKMAEHMALLDLLPDGELATYVARKDGLWSDADTWSCGAVPGAGAIVHIPAAARVTYQGDSAEHVFLVRVDGSLLLRAPDGIRTRMVVDTVYTTMESSLSIEAENETDGSIEIELRPFDIEAYKGEGAPSWRSGAADFFSDGAVVTDTGAGTLAPCHHKGIDDGPGVLGRYEWDPQQLSLGITTMGEARILGKEKQGRAVVAKTAQKGDTTIHLAAPPVAWAEGDVIVIVGTHYTGRDVVSGGYRGSEDEVRTITAVRGSEIGIDRPLEFDHDTPRESLVTYAANLTRNVLVRSGEDLPLDDLNADAAGSVASKLGHIMFMHNEDVTVRYAAFDDLGRSNKNDNLDDIQRLGYDGLNADRITMKIGGVTRPVKTPVDQVTNPRGRYAVHLHRTGATAADETALIEGSVVTGGPGWGFVSHDSRADFRGNVTFGVLGAGYVAETGNETGTWEGNTAINTYGADYNSPVLGTKGVYRYESDDILLTTLLEKRGSWKNHDFGHFGDGFWFQGKLIDVIDNVSANSGLYGFFYMFRAPDEIKIPPGVLEEPLTVHSPRGVHPFAPGLNVFTGNRSIADRGGLSMIGLSSGRINNERSVIQDFTAWEVGQYGTHCQYYPGYTIRDCSFLASTDPRANPSDGVHFLKVTLDIVLANLEIRGFRQMYNLKKGWSPGARAQTGYQDPYEVSAASLAKGEPDPCPLGHAHVLIDPGFTREQAAEPRFMGTTYRPEDVILTSDQLSLGRFEVELDDDSLRIDLDQSKVRYGPAPRDYIRPTLHEGHVLVLRGTKTDSIGSMSIEYHNNVLCWHADAVQHRLETAGYYRMGNGKNGVILEEVFADRYTAERKVVPFVAELDPRWDLSKAIDLGRFDPARHPHVYVPEFLRSE